MISVTYLFEVTKWREMAREGKLRPTPENKYKLKKAGLINRDDYINKQYKGFKNAIENLSQKNNIEINLKGTGNPYKGGVDKNSDEYNVEIPGNPTHSDLNLLDQKRYKNNIFRIAQHEKDELINSIRLDKDKKSYFHRYGSSKSYHNPEKHGEFVDDGERHVSPKIIKNDIKRGREEAFYGIKNKHDNNKRFESGVFPTISNMSNKDISKFEKSNKSVMPISSNIGKYIKK